MKYVDTESCVIQVATTAAARLTNGLEPPENVAICDVPRRTRTDLHRELTARYNARRKPGPSATALGILMIDEYNSMPCEDLSVCPLEYWNKARKRGVSTRILPVVRKFMCVPATSVPSELL